MNTSVSFWRTWPGFCAILLLAALLFFLVTEHTAHFWGALPFAIFLLCPLLHMFMHRGHGSHGGKVDAGPDDTDRPRSSGDHTH